MTRVTFTGANSQVGEYFKGDYNFVSYDLQDPTTWSPLLNSDVVFLLLPKNKNTLESAKQFILTAMNSKIKHIIKIGSLGPWRLVHNQIDTFLKESQIAYTSFDIAPLMNNIFTEQYLTEDKALLDYRDNAPAPYLDPKCLASAIEQSIDNDEHKNKNYRCTGDKQYTITQVSDILNSKGYPVTKIKPTTNQVLHKLSDQNDEVLMTHISQRYMTEGWFPPVSDNLAKYFKTRSRTLEQFIDQDKNIFERRFINDGDL
tara:strand:+ start:5839 stop:6612 length:774 start_codon:yes stop_codon:yes gene_type:complete